LQRWQRKSEQFKIPLKIHSNSRLYNHIPEHSNQTWDYSPVFKDKYIECASIYCQNKTISEICPEELQESWQNVDNKMMAFVRSFEEAKIDLREVDIFNLIPEKHLIQYCNIKDRITSYVFDNYPKPENYDFLLSLVKAVDTIERQRLNIDLNFLKSKLGQNKARKLYKNLSNIESYIRYDAFKSKTGRLTTKKSSFPILTLDSSYRSVLKPNNDWFVELDFNAAELRTLLALSGEKQPTEDLHDWNVQNVYDGKLARKEAKERVFAWLYNPRARDSFLSKIYDRDIVKKKLWDGEHVKTIFGRQIEADEEHSVNYIIQSTTSDLFLKRMIEVARMLEGRRTNVAFSLHDSLILDFSVEDKGILKDLVNVFSDTDLGKYKINLKAGKSFGNMVELNTRWMQ